MAKYYLVSKPVTVADIKTEGLIFKTHVTKGRKPYSIEHLIALLQDNHHTGLVFKNLDDANKYIDKEKLRGTESSSYPHRNDSDYQGYEYAPIIYEIEIDETKKEFQVGEYRSDDGNIVIPCYKFSANDVSIISATLESVKYTFNTEIIKNIPTFENFKNLYKQQYDQSGFFGRNPLGSEMKKKLDSGEISTISEVYDYADNHPDSRTANLIYKK